MAIVQTEIFRGTIDQTMNVSDVNTLVDNVAAQANAFMSTLPADRVLDIKTVLSPATKYGPFTHYQIAVTYRQG